MRPPFTAEACLRMAFMRTMSRPLPAPPGVPAHVSIVVASGALARLDTGSKVRVTGKDDGKAPGLPPAAAPGGGGGRKGAAAERKATE